MKISTVLRANYVLLMTIFLGAISIAPKATAQLNTELDQFLAKSNPTFLVAVKKTTRAGKSSLVFCKEGLLKPAMVAPGILIFDHDDLGNRIDVTAHLDVDSRGTGSFDVLGGVIFQGENTGRPAINASFGKLKQFDQLFFLNGQASSLQNLSAVSYQLFFEINGIQNCGNIPEF